MNIFILLYITGLIDFAVSYVTHGTEKHEKKSHAHVHHAGRHHHAEDVTTEKVRLDDHQLASYDGLNLIFDSEYKVLGFANATQDVAFVLRICEGGAVKLVVDAKTGDILRFKTLDKISLLQSKDLTGGIFEVVTKIFKEYEYGNKSIPGESTEIESSSEKGKELWSKVYRHLGHPDGKTDRRYRSLGFLEKFSVRLKHLYFKSLDGLLQGQGPLRLKQNLNRFISISLGLKKLFAKANGGLKNILSKNVKYEPNSLYNSKNGAEVLVYILRQTGAKFDLGALWGGFLNDIDQVMEVIGLLGGGESKNGVDETFAVIRHVWSALTLRTSLSSLISFLTEAASVDSWSKDESSDFTQILKDFKNITDEQVKKYDNSGVLSPFTQFFTNLTASTLIRSGVNISDIVEKWHRRDVIGGLKFVMDVSIYWVSPAPYTSLFFDSFVAFLNTSSDTGALKRLVPGVSVDKLTGNDGSLWKSICKTYDLDKLLKNKGANDVLKGIPGFGEFSKTYQDSFGKSFNFDQILKGSSMTEYIKTIFITKPIKWTFDITSKFIDITKHIFVDPIKLFLPGINTNDSKLLPLPLMNDSKLLPLPFTLPNLLPTERAETTISDCNDDDCVAKNTKLVPKKDCDDDNPCESTTEKKECKGDSDDKKSVTDSDDCVKKETKPTRKLTTPASTEKDVITKKECDDCEKKITKPPTKKDCDDCEEKLDTEAYTIKVTTDAEDRNHHLHKHHARHHVNRAHQESAHEHKDKHHSRVHHEEHSQKNHGNRKHETHEKKNHLQQHHKIEEKHHNKGEEKLKDRHHHKMHNKQENV